MAEQLAQADFYTILAGMMSGADQTVIMLVAAVFGAVSLLFGYRLYRAFIFFVGFIVGVLIAHHVQSEPNILVTVLFGLISGAILVVLWYVGLFLLGAACGVVLCASLGINFPVLVFALAIACGVLAIVLRKAMIIISTSCNGASTLAPMLASLFKVGDPHAEAAISL
ncbi:MAG: DUF4203 domain-containing protein, partial [Kiritimatiellae bacterium]|nr:DUF4203 domain-containing protein [Kiritimatiellia bacterium]